MESPQSPHEAAFESALDLDAVLPPVESRAEAPAAMPWTAHVRDRWQAVQHRVHAFRAARREARELVLLGHVLSTRAPALPALDAAHASARTAEAAVFDLDAALEASLRSDREDWAALSPWARPLVVTRGLTARGVLRLKRRRALRTHETACAELARATLDTDAALPTTAELAAKAVRAARSSATTARTAAESLLEPYDGAVFPAPVRHAAREVGAFGRVVAQHVWAQAFPRVPALAGLLVGGWLASTYTDSHLSATLHSLGIGSGPRRVLDGETLARLKFWLPLLAAAFASYLGDRVGALLKARYAPQLPPNAP